MPLEIINPVLAVAFLAIWGLVGRIIVQKA